MDAAALASQIEGEIAALPSRYTPILRALRKAWSARLKRESAADLIALAQALEARRPQETKWVAYELIRFHPGAYGAVAQAELERFAASLASWYAVDGFGTILFGPLWAKGRVEDGSVEDWSRDTDRWLRRMALVATVGAKADAARTLPICRTLAADRDDMVEKALSWALRELTKRDRAAVEAFMAEMDDVLGARVKREVRTKLTTGRKNVRSQARQAS